SGSRARRIFFLPLPRCIRVSTPVANKPRCKLAPRFDVVRTWRTLQRAAPRLVSAHGAASFRMPSASEPAPRAEACASLEPFPFPLDLPAVVYTEVIMTNQDRRTFLHSSAVMVATGSDRC